MDRTNKAIWYKRAKIQGQEASLRTLLAGALSRRPKASERLMGDVEQTGVNLFQVHEDLLFGQFLSFMPGMRQTMMTFDANKTAFDLEALAAEQTSDGKKREFVESIGYFGVIDNHVMLVQTKALTARDFEEYLLWLLTQATDSLPGGTLLVLDDPAATVARAKAARSNVRGVTIGGQVKSVATPETAEGKAITRHELEAGALNALRGFLAPDVFDRLSMSESLDGDNIELRLTVRIKGRRVASDAGQELLRTIGRATRHMDPRDYALELDRNGELKGSDLKLRRSVSVATHEAGGLVDESALILHMVDWLKELTAKGLIDP